MDVFFEVTVAWVDELVKLAASDLLLACLAREEAVGAYSRDAGRDGGKRVLVDA